MQKRRDKRRGGDTKKTCNVRQQVGGGTSVFASLIIA